MVGYIRDSVKKMISDAPWMDDATEKKALEKVSDDVTCDTSQRLVSTPFASHFNIFIVAHTHARRLFVCF